MQKLREACLFVVLEGMDACGKDTQGAAIVEYYKKAYPEVVVQLLTFPRYKSPTGQLILNHLLEKWQCMEKGMVNAGGGLGMGGVEPMEEGYVKSPVDALVFQCVHFVDKIANTPPELWSRKPNHIFIAVRYWPSSYSYGKADGCDPVWLEGIHNVLPKPDHCIMLDVPPEVAAARRPDRRDRYEKQEGLMAKVRANYKDLFGTHQGDSWHVIDATGSVGEVTSRILDITGR